MDLNTTPERERIDHQMKFTKAKRGIIAVLVTTAICIGATVQANNQDYCDNIFPGTMWDGKSCSAGKTLGAEFSAIIVGGGSASTASLRPSYKTSGGGNFEGSYQSFCDNVWPGMRWNGYTCNRSKPVDHRIRGALGGTGSVTVGYGGSSGSGSDWCASSSGACSGHRGVNCDAGPDSDGSVICNDGWTGSSVMYVRR